MTGNGLRLTLRKAKELDLILTAEKSKLTGCAFMAQKTLESQGVSEEIRGSPHGDKRKLHTKLFFGMISNCMDKIQLEDVFEVSHPCGRILICALNS